MPNPLRIVARILTGSTYAFLGFDVLRSPGARVGMAGDTLATLRRFVPLPEDDELLVRSNAAVQALTGTTLALGIAPRISAITLFGSLVPTTIAGHSFWAVGDAASRGQQRIQFHKNMAMLGGLVYAVMDRTAGGQSRSDSAGRGPGVRSPERRRSVRRLRNEPAMTAAA